jgi:hypothetical protein
VRLTHPSRGRDRRPVLVLALVAALALGAAACSEDDGADTRTAGSVAIIGPPPPEGGGSVSAVGTGCTTKGATTKLPAGSYEIGLDEWSVTVPDSIPAGVSRIVVKNFGSEAHEVVIAPVASADALPMAGGRVDDAALEELEPKRIMEFASNTICEGTFELAAGDYVVFCNLHDEDATPAVSHLAQGMVAELHVG